MLNARYTTPVFAALVAFSIQLAIAPAALSPARASANPQVAESTKLNSDEIAAVNRVSAYFNKLKTIVGNFVQVGPGSHFSEGRFYLSKPGRLRFEYDPPTPLLVVADGTWLIVNNKKLKTADHYPLSATPLRLLLSDKIDLLEEAKIIQVYQDRTLLTITLEDKNALVSGQLTLVFGREEMELKQWIIVDGQGNQITVSLRDVDFETKPDPALFVVKLPQKIEQSER